MSSTSNSLQIIFSVFLGLMLTAFIGIGVYTFYPPPEEPDAQIEALDRQRDELQSPTRKEDLTDAEREEMQAIERNRQEIYEAAREARQPWKTRTSIILVLFATLSMAVSVTRSYELPVIGNGLLLGGIFTMIYGAGWVVTSDTSVTRFLVIAFALAVTIGLGYVRFVRGESAAGDSEDATDASRGDSGDVSDLNRRISRVEKRLDNMRDALRSD